MSGKAMQTREKVDKSSESLNRMALSPETLGLVRPESDFKSVNFALSVHVQRQNWRQGTVACQGRADVTGSNKKPWRQKGTGRARAGANTSPLWKGGGVIHGPQPRTRVLKITKKLGRQVRAELFWNFLSNNKIIVLDWEAGQKPTTKSAFNVLKKDGLHAMRVNLFVQSHDDVTMLSFANIPTVRSMLFDAPNAYSLSDASYWIVLKKDIDAFKNMVAQWI